MELINPHQRKLIWILESFLLFNIKNNMLSKDNAQNHLYIKIDILFLKLEKCLMFKNAQFLNLELNLPEEYKQLKLKRMWLNIIKKNKLRRILEAGSLQNHRQLLGRPEEPNKRQEDYFQEQKVVQSQQRVHRIRNTLFSFDILIKILSF